MEEECTSHEISKDEYIKLENLMINSNHELYNVNIKYKYNIEENIRRIEENKDNILNKENIYFEIK